MENNIANHSEKINNEQNLILVNNHSNKNNEIVYKISNLQLDYKNPKYIPTPTSTKANSQDLVHCFQYFLIFGRVLSVIPINGFFIHGQVESLKFRWKSFAFITNTIVLICLGFSTCVGVVGFFKYQRDNANQFAAGLQFFVFYGSGFFIYTYFHLYSEDFIHLLKKWKHIKLYYSFEDRTLRRDAHIIAFVIFISITLEHATWYLRDVHHFGTLNSFYNTSLSDWATVIPYHPWITVFATIISKFGLYSWNFYDVLIIIISRAMYAKYKILNHVAKKSLFELGFNEKQDEKWKGLLADHLALTNLLVAVNEFMSPILLVSYGANIYDLCTHISNAVLSSKISSWIGTAYSIWSFSHLSLRLFLVSFMASKINEHALNTRKILKKCPVQLYTKEIQKFETQLFQSKLGLGAFGSFTITKNFMLKLLSVVFTIEIVLLQQNATVHK